MEVTLSAITAKKSFIEVQQIEGQVINIALKNVCLRHLWVSASEKTTLDGRAQKLDHVEVAEKKYLGHIGGQRIEQISFVTKNVLPYGRLKITLGKIILAGEVVIPRIMARTGNGNLGKLEREIIINVKVVRFMRIILDAL